MKITNQTHAEQHISPSFYLHDWFFIQLDGCLGALFFFSNHGALDMTSPLSAPPSRSPLSPPSMSLTPIPLSELSSGRIFPVKFSLTALIPRPGKLPLLSISWQHSSSPKEDSGNMCLSPPLDQATWEWGFWCVFSTSMWKLCTLTALLGNYPQERLSCGHGKLSGFRVMGEYFMSGEV